jgi:hypothetical protein
MPTTNPTFEDVDKHIQAADLSAFQSGGKHHLTKASAANPAAALPNVCAAYKVIKPILVLISGIPLIPQKWRDAIKAFIGVMDTLCP